MNDVYDVIIVGGGPAGLSSAIYLARAKFSVLVIEKEAIGGQITITSDVVNYPGILSTSGKELTEKMRQQAQNFGAEFLLADVKSVHIEDNIKSVETSKGDFESVGIILATGANPRKLGFPGEKQFQGRGVAYCATCDGEFFTGMQVFVIGGGFAAAEEAVFLTKYASKVTVIVREEDFTCAKTVADKTRNNEKIEVHYQSEIVEAGGQDKLEYAIFRNNKSGKTWKYTADEDSTFGIFVFAGYQPATKLFKDQVEINKDGNLVTDMNQKTNVDGVYGAGDVCVKNLRQVVTAVSDGAIAATSLEKYIPEMLSKLSLSTREQKEQIVDNNNRQIENENPENSDQFITEETKQKLASIFDTLKENLVIKCEFDDSPLAKEMKSFIEEFSALSDKISYEINNTGDAGIPTYSFYDEKDNYLNVKFHCVPGGHEFNSFIIAIYNAVGPGQAIDENDLYAIKQVSTPHNIKIMVSLSCTMCPELVMAAQRIALENENIETEVFDLSHFPKVKEKYKIMSVPCMIIDDEEVHFGKKDSNEIIRILEKRTV